MQTSTSSPTAPNLVPVFDVLQTETGTNPAVAAVFSASQTAEPNTVGDQAVRSEASSIPGRILLVGAAGQAEPEQPPQPAAIAGVQNEGDPPTEGYALPLSLRLGLGSAVSEGGPARTAILAASSEADARPATEIVQPVRKATQLLTSILDADDNVQVVELLARANGVGLPAQTQRIARTVEPTLPASEDAPVAAGDPDRSAQMPALTPWLAPVGLVLLGAGWCCWRFWRRKPAS